MSGPAFQRVSELPSPCFAAWLTFVLRCCSGVVFIPVTIGDNCIIERDSVVQAASIGSYVHIGKGAIVVRCCLRALAQNCFSAPSSDACV